MSLAISFVVFHKKGGRGGGEGSYSVTIARCVRISARRQIIRCIAFLLSGNVSLAVLLVARKAGGESGMECFVFLVVYL